MSVYKGRRKKSFRNFIMLGKDMLDCDEWKRLSPAAKVLYINIKAGHNGRNNGDICLFYSKLETVRGLGSPSTVSKAFKELEREGWIKKTGNGGLFRNPNRYEMTGRFDDYIVNKWQAGPDKYRKSPDFEARKEPPIGHDEMGIKIMPAKPDSIK